MLRVGSTGPLVQKWQETMVRRFASYAKAANGGPLKADAYFGYDDSAVAKEWQRRVNRAQTGEVSDEELVILGLITAPKFVGYGLPGTWGIWHTGPQASCFYKADLNRVAFQGVGSNTGAFLNPDPMHSYVDARNEQVAELLRLALPDPRPKFISGYSLGADSVVRFLQQWPAERRNEIKAVFTFGSPGRPPGATKLGPDPGGAGISGVHTPEWARDREWSYTIDGDMYSEAVGLLPTGYEILTRMELTPEFMVYLFGVLTSAVGPSLLGLAGVAVPGFGMLAPLLGLITPGPVSQTSGPIQLMTMMLNLPAIVQSLFALLKFLFTNAHGRYWVDPIFNGMTAEDHAASVIRSLS